jgi:hypothetical protein
VGVTFPSIAHTYYKSNQPMPLLINISWSKYNPAHDCAFLPIKNHFKNNFILFLCEDLWDNID